ncbi:MAG: MFS transporter [Pseudonocardia sp.]|nr:MFS transporter [Pseudonocardia sp.]
MNARRPVNATRWKVVAAAMFCCGWGGNQFTPLLIMYREAGYSVLTVDALLGAYVVGLVPGLLLAGGLSDRYGRRPVMVAGTVASVLASALLALGELGSAWIALGRFVTGIGVAVAMAVGSTWVKELSEGGATAGAGARRAALWLTLGFALGAGAAGVLAQWGPYPMVLPYVVHVVLTAVVLPFLPRVPETRAAGAAGPRFGGVRHPRFVRVITPMAPWISAPRAWRTRSCRSSSGTGWGTGGWRTRPWSRCARSAPVRWSSPWPNGWTGRRAPVPSSSPWS